MNDTSLPIIGDIRKTLDFLHDDGDIFEIAVFDEFNRPLAGWFKNKDKAIEEVLRMCKNPDFRAIYTSINPCHEALLSRSYEKIKRVRTRTSDKDILHYRYLFLDIDPQRPSDTNSTDEEHDLAIKTAYKIRDALLQEGWVDPLIADSGNGACLVYPLPGLEVTDDNRELIKDCLIALNQRYGDSTVIDQSVHNPARLIKLFGTPVRKGDATPERPHRVSKILSLPEVKECLILANLKSLAKRKDAVTRNSSGKLDVPAYLNHYNIEVVKEKRIDNATLFCLSHCVFDENHTPNESAIVQNDNGVLSYQCFHDSCQGRTWQEARERISGKDNLKPFISGNKVSEEVVDILSSLLKWNDLLSFDVKTEYILEKLIPERSITLLFGRGGTGKTSLALQMAHAVAEGLAFGELKTIKTPVYFIDFENPLAILKERIEKIGLSDNLWVWHISNEIQPPKLDSKRWELYKKLPPGLLIFDTLRASHLSDENDSKPMALIMSRLKELRERNFTVLLLHHTPKSNENIFKGSTALLDLADHVLGLEGVKDSDTTIEFDKDTLYRLGVRIKTRYEPYHIFLKFNSDKKGFEIAKDPDYEKMGSIYELLKQSREPLKQKELKEQIKKELDFTESETRRLLKRGIGLYWETRRGVNNATLYIPLNFGLSVCQYIYTQQTDKPNSIQTENLTNRPLSDTEQTIDNIEFDSLTEGIKQTDKQEIIDLEHEELEIIE
ncbi:MAG: AAA family ATPase [Thermodesulfovibrionales bacterium]